MKTKTPMYFYRDAFGLNADIQRHRKTEQELLQKIKETEESTILSETEKIVYLNSFRGILCILQQSKAEVVNNLGRKIK